MRIGLAGLGRMGAVHAEALGRLDTVTSVVGCDIDAQRAEQVAAKGGFETVADVDALLSAGTGVEALLVATATDTHTDLVTATVSAGIPVFVEKPLAADLYGTQALVQTLAASQVPVQVGFQRRFDPGYLAARDAVASGRLGWLHTVRSSTLDPAPPTAEYVAASGGIARDCAVHDFDSIRWVTGREVSTVYAVGSNRGDPMFAEHDDVDTMSVLLTLDDGTVAQVACTRYNAAGYDVRLEVFGSAGSVTAGLDDKTPLTSTETGATFPAGPAYTGFPERFAAAYEAELRAFVELVRAGEPASCTPTDALEACYVAEAAERSRRQGRAVAVSEVRR